MAGQTKSRWANDDEDAALEAQRKHEKESKKRAKTERRRKLEEDEENSQRRETLAASTLADETPQHLNNGASDITERPFKRRRLSPEQEFSTNEFSASKLLRFPASEWGPCRHVDNFEKLNHIEEGSYGWVSRAKETATGEIVALKRLKMDNANDGFPVTGLREIQTLMASKHTNIVALREVVMGDRLEE